MTAVEPIGAVDAVTLSHLAGPDVTIDLSDTDVRLRQRCVWCGALLVDVTVTGGEPDESMKWTDGGIVRHDLDSGVYFEIPFDSEVDDVPGDSCMMLPLELTGSAAVRR